MAYILIWSFIFQGNWIGGTALFSSVYDCEQAKAFVLTNKKISSVYLECKLVENNKNLIFAAHADNDMKPNLPVLTQ